MTWKVSASIPVSFRGLTHKPDNGPKSEIPDWQYWKQELNVDSSVNVKVCSECLQSFVGEVILKMCGTTQEF